MNHDQTLLSKKTKNARKDEAEEKQKRELRWSSLSSFFIAWEALQHNTLWYKYYKPIADLA